MIDIDNENLRQIAEDWRFEDWHFGDANRVFKAISANIASIVIAEIRESIRLNPEADGLHISATDDYSPIVTVPWADLATWPDDKQATIVALKALIQRIEDQEE